MVFISLIALFFIVGSARRISQETQNLQNDINGLRQQEQTLRQQAEAVKQSLTPEQLQILTATHTLVDRKRFSWSQLFADLEMALPGDVRVKRIAVRGVTKQGAQAVTELELTVIAKSPSTVTEMIAEMDRGGIFRANLLSQNLQRGRGESGAEYELLVAYTPRAGTPTTASPVAALEAPQNLTEGGAR